MRKKIMTVAFDSMRRVRAQGVFEAGKLIVVDMADITGNPEDWIPPLQADIANKVANGWVCMVDDMTHSFPFSGEAAGVSFNFDAQDAGGRTMLQTALDWYFAMDSRGSIILGDGLERHAIRVGGENSLLDIRSDEKGRAVYVIDWRRFGAAHRALLMCVVGAVQEEPLSEHWLANLCGQLAQGRPNPCLSTSFKAITMEHFETQRQQFAQAVEAMEARKHV